MSSKDAELDVAHRQAVHRPDSRSGLRGPAGGSSARSEDTDGEAEVCAICHEAYAADDLLIELPCAHLFHEPCITRWLKREDFEASCPFRCRVPLLVREA